MATQFIFEAIGTKWVIDITDLISETDEAQLLADIKDRIAVFDKDYSRFRADSLVSEMARKAGTYTMPDDAETMMQLYYDLYGLTGGYLTPLIGQVMVDAGYDAVYTLKQQKDLVRPPAWEEVLEYRHPELVVKQPVLLDFGAAGKGYLIDIVGRIIAEKGLRNFCVDAGGDILYRTSGNEALRVGLENPQDFSQAVGVVELKNKSLCGSAGNRRAWQNFHHIIDPHKLASPKNILATWVIADTTLLADALASCLFFVPSKHLIPRYAFEYLVLYADFSIDKSANFPGDVFSD